VFTAYKTRTTPCPTVRKTEDIPTGELADVVAFYRDRVDFRIVTGHILGRCELCGRGLIDPPSAEAIVSSHHQAWAVEACASCLAGHIDQRVDVYGHDITVLIPGEQF
jgi:hypothetical protein